MIVRLKTFHGFICVPTKQAPIYGGKEMIGMRIPHAPADQISKAVLNESSLPLDHFSSSQFLGPAQSKA